MSRVHDKSEVFMLMDDGFVKMESIKKKRAINQKGGRS
jgi:hypothetical protein